MRTDDEIIAYAKELKKCDPFGFGIADLICRLPAEKARPFLKSDAVLTDWKQYERTRAAVQDEINDYLPFAWDKANNCRGISAWRSLMHMKAWLWLAGETEAAAALDGYSHYGKPQLRAISEWIGFDWRSHDDGKWRNDEDGQWAAPDLVPLADLPFTKEASS